MTSGDGQKCHGMPIRRSVWRGISRVAGYTGRSICLTAYSLVLAACFGLLAPIPTALADFAKGWEAYRRAQYAEAKAEWLPLAQSDDKAMVGLGRMYFFGQGVEKNIPMARQLFNSAWEIGNLDALYYLGEIEARNRSTPKAKQLWLLAAEKGHARSQFTLGQYLSFGIGIPKDDSAAFRWWMEAAGQGVNDAQLNVAYAYSQGKGTNKDLVHAYKWLTIAMENEGEFTRARTDTYRKHHAKNMTPEEIIHAKSLASEFLLKKGWINKVEVPKASGQVIAKIVSIEREKWESFLDPIVFGQGSDSHVSDNNQNVIETPHERALYFLARGGPKSLRHPAFPGLVKWVVVSSNGELSIELEGYYAGNKNDFMEWIKEHSENINKRPEILLHW
ncbi:MAG: tetratricopeptide repeat protein [Alphaproteobacteria bacterium]